MSHAQNQRLQIEYSLYDMHVNPFTVGLAMLLLNGKYDYMTDYHTCNYAPRARQTELYLLVVIIVEMAESI